MSKFTINFHADDYGLSFEQSKRILDCYTNGCLNGISIFPNVSDLQSKMEMLEGTNLDKSIHFNLAEGHCVAEASEVPLLVDQSGNFCHSFVWFLLHSFLPGCAAIRSQIKRELSAQLQVMKAYLDFDELNIDSHIHYHMIPMIFDIVLDICVENKVTIRYLRFPEENLMLYIPIIAKLSGIKLANLIKVALLNVLSLRNKRKYFSIFHEKIVPAGFSGVLFSGHMFYDNVSAIVEHYRKKHYLFSGNLEVLAHPGGIYEKEVLETLSNGSDVSFLSSHNREREADMLVRIHIGQTDGPCLTEAVCGK